MSKKQQEKFTISTTPLKKHSKLPFVQIEGEITEAQLAAIAGGGTRGDSGTTGNHNEIMVRTQEVVMSQQKREKVTDTTTLEKSRYDKPAVKVEGELSEAELDAIAGGQTWGHARGLTNHNEIVVKIQEGVMSKQQQKRFTASTTSEKTRQHKPFVQVEEELTEG